MTKRFEPGVMMTVEAAFDIRVVGGQRLVGVLSQMIRTPAMSGRPFTVEVMSRDGRLPAVADSRIACNGLRHPLFVVDGDGLAADAVSDWLLRLDTTRPDGDVVVVRADLTSGLAGGWMSLGAVAVVRRPEALLMWRRWWERRVTRVVRGDGEGV